MTKRPSCPHPPTLPHPRCHLFFVGAKVLPIITQHAQRFLHGATTNRQKHHSQTTTHRPHTPVPRSCVISITSCHSTPTHKTQGHGRPVEPCTTVSCMHQRHQLHTHTLHTRTHSSHTHSSHTGSRGGLEAWQGLGAQRSEVCSGTHAQHQHQYLHTLTECAWCTAGAVLGCCRCCLLVVLFLW